MAAWTASRYACSSCTMSSCVIVGITLVSIASARASTAQVHSMESLDTLFTRSEAVTALVANQRGLLLRHITQDCHDRRITDNVQAHHIRCIHTRSAVCTRVQLYTHKFSCMHTSSAVCTQVQMHVHEFRCMHTHGRGPPANKRQTSSYATSANGRKLITVFCRHVVEPTWSSAGYGCHISRDDTLNFVSELRVEPKCARGNVASSQEANPSVKKTAPLAMHLQHAWYNQHEEIRMNKALTDFSRRSIPILYNILPATLHLAPLTQKCVGGCVHNEKHQSVNVCGHITIVANVIDFALEKLGTTYHA